MLLVITRLWILTSRGEMDEDPVLFGLTDAWSIGIAAAMAVVLLLAV